jgi:spore germination protein YaaH
VTDDRTRLLSVNPPAARASERSLRRGLSALGLLLLLVVVGPGSSLPGGEPGALYSLRPAPIGASQALSAHASSARLRASRSPADAPVRSGQEPSEVALDAAAHEGDRIAFTPGGRVTVPFRPRQDDGWWVDGNAPSALPAGAASGRAMAAAVQGSAWSASSDAPQASGRDSAVDTQRPVDGSSSGPSIAADPASAIVPSAASLDPSAANSLRRQVFGFLPYWELNNGSTRLNYSALSTIAYFGVGVDASGNLRKRNSDGSRSVGWAGWTSSRMTSIIQAGHRRGTRIVLTVEAFAWTTSQAAVQSALLGSPAARLRLARQIAAAVRDRGADGVNLDFEPLVTGRAAEFVALVRQIRTELNRVHKGYQLTFDTTGAIGAYPIEDATAPGAADAIFIMGYDYRTASSPTAGSIAPLGGSMYDLVDTILAYTERVAARKLILGIPYYGRAWSTVSSQPRAATQRGTRYGRSTSVTYATAAALARQHGRRYDSTEASPWVAYRRRICTPGHGCVTTWREVYYDDAQSLRAKYDTIIRFGLRGAGIWALGYDDMRPELYRTIVAKFVHDTTPPVTGIGVLAARQGSRWFKVTWSAVDMNPIRSYDVQVSVDRGPWRAWRNRTRARAAIMHGRDGHTYAFRARATDSKGNRGSWRIANLPTARPLLRRGSFATVAADTLTVRNRPDIAGSVVTTLALGDIVAITGGPVAADGYNWYQVSGPFSSWAPTRPVRSGNWVAGGSGSVAYLAPRTAPNTTVVNVR